MSVKLIYEPRVYLVGSIQADDAEIARFLADEGVERWETDTEVGGQKLVEVAGRLCYKSYAKPRPGGNAAYIGHIKEVGHGSVVEHAVYEFILTGVSRSLTHELVRHRAGWSYSQRSQRFCDEAELSVVVPPALRREVDLAVKAMYWVHGEFCPPGEIIEKIESGELGEPSDEETLTGLRWLDAIVRDRNEYKRLSDYLFIKYALTIGDPTLRRKRAREAARSVLPNATETQIYCTANARALRHFMELRSDESADAEIRAVAFKLWEVLSGHSPNLFGDYTPTDGGLKTEWSKI